MKCVTLSGQVGDDGVLRLDVPTGFANMMLDVVVVLQPASSPELNGQEAALSWPDFVRKFAGSLPALPDVDEQYDADGNRTIDRQAERQ